MSSSHTFTDSEYANSLARLRARRACRDLRDIGIISDDTCTMVVQGFWLRPFKFGVRQPRQGDLFKGKV